MLPQHHVLIRLPTNRVSCCSIFLWRKVGQSLNINWLFHSRCVTSLCLNATPLIISLIFFFFNSHISMELFFSLEFPLLANISPFKWIKKWVNKDLSGKRVTEVLGVQYGCPDSPELDCVCFERDSLGNVPIFSPLYSIRRWALTSLTTLRARWRGEKGPQQSANDDDRSFFLFLFTGSSPF